MTDIPEFFVQSGMRMLEAFGEAAFGFDAGGRCVYASVPALALLHLSEPGEAVGRPAAELLKRPWPATLPPWERCFASLASQPERALQSDLETLVRPDGVEMQVAIVVTAHRLPDGTLAHAALVRDVGERSRQAKALHASVKSFRALLDGVSDAILFVSRQGKVVDANLGVLSMFGHSPAALQGKSVDNLLDPREHDRGLIEAAATAAAGGRSVSLEFTARNRKGEAFPAEIHLYPSSYFNQPVALAIVHDISGRRRHEATLMAARDQAQRNSRLKDEIIRNMSHEFRTPLAAMIGMGDLLADTELDEEQRTYLEEARVGAQGLLVLVNAILDLAKLESGHYRLNNVDFNLNDLVDERVRRYALMAADKRLTVRAEVAPGLPEVMSGDMDAIGKILTLLLDNAVKFTDAGEVVVSAARVGELRPDGCDVRLAVRDTGIGIAEGALADLFDAFVQGDGSATRRHGGVGLGLGIASRLAVLLGGRLTVESRPGAGSEFHLTLAFAPPEFATD